jgi:hypothetical protein
MVLGQGHIQKRRPASKARLPAYAVIEGCPWNPNDLCETIRLGLWDDVVAAIQPRNGDERATAAAASMGRIDLLSDLCQKGHTYGKSTCFAAASKGYIDCLHYLYKRGCAWDNDTPRAALRARSRHCFEYAALRGCPLWERDRKRAVAFGWKTELHPRFARLAIMVQTASML